MGGQSTGEQRVGENRECRRTGGQGIGEQRVQENRECRRTGEQSTGGGRTESAEEREDKECERTGRAGYRRTESAREQGGQGIGEQRVRENREGRV